MTAVGDGFWGEACSWARKVGGLCCTFATGFKKISLFRTFRAQSPLLFNLFEAQCPSDGACLDERRKKLVGREDGC